MKTHVLAAVAVAASMAWAAEIKMVAPPDGAVVLFEGGGKRDVSKWRGAKLNADGLLLAGATTKDTFQSTVIHLEFNSPAPEKGKRNSGNSGIYIQRRYEIQILDTQTGKPQKGGCAAIYQFKPADTNETRKRGEWQHYVIFFQAAKWDKPADGAKPKKTQNVRMTVFHNGVKVHDDVDVPNKTGHGRPEGPEPREIHIQNHGWPVAFRNVWVLPHEQDDDPRVKALLAQLEAADPKGENEVSDSPSRRDFLAASAAGLALAAARPARTQPVKRPNLVFVFADQLRYSSCGYAGDTLARTPNIDRLAAGGARASRNCVSMHARMRRLSALRLMTGKYTTSTGMVINELRLSPDHECFCHACWPAAAMKWDTSASGTSGPTSSASPRRSTATPSLRPAPTDWGSTDTGPPTTSTTRYYDAYYYETSRRRSPTDAPVWNARTNPTHRPTWPSISLGRAAARGDAKRSPSRCSSPTAPRTTPGAGTTFPKKYADMFRQVRFPTAAELLDATQRPLRRRLGDRLPKGYQHRHQVQQMKQGYYAMTANLDWNMGRLLAGLEKAGAGRQTPSSYSPAITARCSAPRAVGPSSSSTTKRLASPSWCGGPARSPLPPAPTRASPRPT